MDTTSNLNLPVLAPAQALKHITHNEAIRGLDRLVHLQVAGILSVPPSGWRDGDIEAETRFIIGKNAQNEWVGHEGDIVVLEEDKWVFLTPQTGWLCWNTQDSSLRVREANAWKFVPSSLSNRLGVNTPPNPAHRLSVKADSSLFDAENGSHRLVVNRSHSTDVASVVFQDQYSGRAEFGLAGADGFSLRVSDDGTTFQKALGVDHASGDVSISQDLLVAGRIRQEGNMVLDTSNTPAPLVDRGVLTQGLNLDEYKTSGYWAQTKLNGADQDLNYPVEARGLLIVFRAWVMVFQTYHVIAHASDGESANIYTRALFGTSWTPWRRMDFTALS